MATPKLIAVSDIHKLAVLDLHKIIPKRVEHDGRFWGFFDPQETGEILEAYDSGSLNVVARDFASSISRVKDRIFEIERTRARSGSQNATAYR